MQVEVDPVVFSNPPTRVVIFKNGVGNIPPK